MMKKPDNTSRIRLWAPKVSAVPRRVTASTNVLSTSLRIWKMARRARIQITPMIELRVTDVIVWTRDASRVGSDVLGVKWASTLAARRETTRRTTIVSTIAVITMAITLIVGTHDHSAPSTGRTLVNRFAPVA